MIVCICKRLLHKKHLNHSERLVADSLNQTPGETFHLELNWTLKYTCNPALSEDLFIGSSWELIWRVAYSGRFGLLGV